jgi:molybdenum cofactor biosynthesis enzyme MoaA
MVPSSDLLSFIQARHPTVMRVADESNDTARSWTIPGYKGSFGFISSMSDHFCATCNRLRLTADGQIKVSIIPFHILRYFHLLIYQVCLFDAKEVSLRDEMRMGASDDALLKIVGQAVAGKMEKHAGMEDINVTTNRPMILIGG